MLSFTSMRLFVLTAIMVAGALSVGFAGPALANEETEHTGSGIVLGILSVPAIEERVIYFAGWPNKLYAFDEEKNELRWHVALGHPEEYLELETLPAPPPVLVGSLVLAQLGNTVWAVSKVDGHTVWKIDNVHAASRDSALRSSQRLPGYIVSLDEPVSSVFTIELDGGIWACSKRRLGDGSQEWVFQLNSMPRGFWVDTSGVWLAYAASGSPGTLINLNAATGEPVWTAPVTEGASFETALLSGRRIFIVEQLPDGQFQVTAVSIDSGSVFRTISYADGNFIGAYESEGKLVFLHEKPDEDGQHFRISFRLYHTSLNPIRFLTLCPARPDQPFGKPAIDRNLFFYGATAYSLYDGNPVWQFKEDEQRPVVDWAADLDHLYLWDSNGSIVALERLTGLETWRTPLDVLPPVFLLGPNWSGASMVLDNQRLIVSTPAGEIYRIDVSRGEPFPGKLRVECSVSSLLDVEERQPSAPGQNSDNRLVIILLVVPLSLAVLFFLLYLVRQPESRKTP